MDSRSYNNRNNSKNNYSSGDKKKHKKKKKAKKNRDKSEDIKRKLSSESASPTEPEELETQQHKILGRTLTPYLLNELS